jgi:hypothetical protein
MSHEFSIIISTTTGCLGTTGPKIVDLSISKLKVILWLAGVVCSKIKGGLGDSHNPDMTVAGQNSCLGRQLGFFHSRRAQRSATLTLRQLRLRLVLGACKNHIWSSAVGHNPDDSSTRLVDVSSIPLLDSSPRVQRRCLLDDASNNARLDSPNEDVRSSPLVSTHLASTRLLSSTRRDEDAKMLVSSA